MRSSQRATEMTRVFVIAPVSTAASGKTSWMLKIERVNRSRAASHPVRPRVNGGDIEMIAAGLRLQPPANNVQTPATRLNRAKPTARRRRFRLLLPGNG